jgi:MFS transporter, DHA1 family, staphyloferrin A biosynthesis exporter
MVSSGEPVFGGRRQFTSRPTGLSFNIRTFDSLRIRDYRLLWLGQLNSTMGQWMDQVTRLWLIYSITHSAIDLGIVSAARGIPFLIFGVIAGAMADRYGRKFQLIAAQAGNMVLNIVLAALVFTGMVEPWHVYVTGFLSGILQAFQQPARQVLINDIVGERYLFNAISLNAAAFNLSRSVGPAIAGVVIELSGVDICYFLQAGLYAFATIWTVQMKVPEPAAGAQGSASASRHQSLFGSVVEGMRYIATQKNVLALILLALAPVVLGMPFVSLMPMFAIDVFHGSAKTQGMLLAMLGVGALAGALGMASLRRRKAGGKLLIAGAVGFGIALIFFALSPVLWMAMAFVLVAGICNAAYTTQNQTILQSIVPTEFRGRVLGVYLLDVGLMPLGSLLLGVLASFLGAPLTVAIMGTLCVLLAAAIGVWARDLWNLTLASKQAVPVSPGAAQVKPKPAEESVSASD